jgi:hypothetical protein
MPFPYRAHAVPLPYRAAKGLDCVFPIWFTQCGRVWFTHAMPCLCRAHAMPRPCRYESEFLRPRHSAAWARHGHSMTCELASAVQRLHVGDLRAFGFFWLPRGFPRRLSEHINTLNCRTSSSDISGYYADFHEGHGTVGEWQGRGMACVN